MKKQIMNLFFCLFIAVFTLSMLSSFALAQKRFEGYLEQTTVRKSDMPMQPREVTEKEKVFYKAGKFKTMNLTTGKSMIYRFDKELMWTIDHNDKSFTEVTFAQMKEGMQKMRSAMKQEMKDISPEERKMMEKLMGKKMGKMLGGDEGGFEISIKRTGKKKNIMGYSCEQVFLNMNDEPMMEMWITNKYSMGNDFLKVYEKMGFMKGELPEDAKKIQGIPLATSMTIDMGMGKMESETKVTKLEKTSVSDREFEVPKGYNKKNSKMPFGK